MKKILFATTALVATAGVAAAEVTFSGYGRFGLAYQENRVHNGFSEETYITSRLRLQIDATAESDNGVSFGARARIQQNGTDGATATTMASPAGTGINAVRFWASAGGLELGVGNIYGALESMPGQYDIDLGLTGGSYAYTVYDGNGDFYSSGGNGAANRNGIELLYSAGPFSAHISYSNAVGPMGERLAAYLAYEYSGFTFAVAGQDSDNAGDTEWSATIGGDLGPVAATLAYADNGTNGERWALMGTYTVMDGLNLQAYYADDSIQGDAYGVDFNYSLGGGVSLRGGIEEVFGTTQGDLGVRFDF
ncbi:porin [Pseudooceanicola sp. C21-150M6]|uniref:porin n=1 Tax=Pseudooceanicola sp. C21-150M6 TaxID=3434355 RepID=UPI003D7FF0AB